MHLKGCTYKVVQVVSGKVVLHIQIIVFVHYPESSGYFIPSGREFKIVQKTFYAMTLNLRRQNFVTAIYKTVHYCLIVVFI